MKQSIQEASERFVDIAFGEDPNIKNLEDFRIALKNAFDSPRGKNASGQFDEETIIELFESRECDKKLRDNIGDKKTDELMGEVKRGDFELIQDGKPKFVSIPKTISIKSYTRAGISVGGYSKSYQKWTPVQKRFIKVRKAKRPSEIIAEYNKHFKNNPRPSSSLKTAIFRLNK